MPRTDEELVVQFRNDEGTGQFIAAGLAVHSVVHRLMRGYPQVLGLHPQTRPGSSPVGVDPLLLRQPPP